MEKVAAPEMVTLARCKTLMEKDGSVYSTDELLMIRDFLYKLADYEFSVYLKEKRRDIDDAKANEEVNEQVFKEAA